MFKIGLIGCGAISDGHVIAFETIEDACITAVCDINENNLNMVCEKTRAKGYSDYKKMIKEESLDLAVITLPHGLHCEAACFCAEAGVDVFLEKPMALNSDECKTIIDTCKKCNVMLWVGHLQKYMPANVFAKALIDSGELGELIGFSEVRNGEYFTQKRPKWFGTKVMSGGGIMMNLGAHALDKMKYFSNSDIAEISGSIHMHAGLDCEDGVQAVVKMKNGVVGTVTLIGYTTRNDYETVLYLTNGEIRMRLENSNVVEYCKNGEPMQEYDVKQGASWGMTYQMQDVIRTLREKKKTPSVDGEYGLDVIRAIKKFYKDE
ncbi:MAG: Gfo/Idh/MocA family oxidoreductase [Oscillospiraceae bacterium]|nr:Gfo/Idh/MocA family oxidoreductase [Oscillospiraceae bacterium]